jgi:hypothetical protein
MRLPCAEAARAVIQDISRNGIALRHSGSVVVGRDVELDLPDAGGPVTGRIVRAADGIVAIAFSQEPAMLARIDRTLASLSVTRRVA